MKAKKPRGLVVTRSDVMARIEVGDGGCWYLSGRKRRDYQKLNDGRPAHRVTYEIFKGAVPDGLEMDHLCRNKACVNPSHLEAVTRGENLRRSQAACLSFGFRSQTERMLAHLRPGFREALDHQEPWAVEAATYRKR